MAKFIWQLKDWPKFVWDAQTVVPVLSEVVFKEGEFLGRLGEIGFENKARAGLEALSAEIVNSAAIEGEALNLEDVRSSVARRMEIVFSEKGRGRESHVLDARVEMMLDATRGWQRPMTFKRLKGWHAALFPAGYSGLTRIAVGKLRDDKGGPMQVVSRHGSLMRVHFEAPPSANLPAELKGFLFWLGAEDESMPPLVKIAIAHLWFLTLHPFDDGNGRLARALTDYLLSRFEKSELRFYSLSAQIQKEKSAYYDALEHAQRVHPWGQIVEFYMVKFVGSVYADVDSPEDWLVFTGRRPTGDDDDVFTTVFPLKRQEGGLMHAGCLQGIFSQSVYSPFKVAEE